jgi:hypothetical protein
VLVDDPNSASGKRVIADNPACMAPDGGDCCPQYHALLTALRRIVSLEEKNVPKYAQQIAREALNR